MNEEMKKAYRDTFNKIHASEALAGKVKNMMNQKQESSVIFNVKKWTSVAAAVLAVLLGSNVVVYAATGNTWVESVRVYFSGDTYQAEIVQGDDGQGDVAYDAAISEDGDKVIINLVETAKVVEKNGKVLLKDRDVEIDLTKELEDGNASGTYEIGGLAYYYEITGESGAWNLSVNNGNYDIKTNYE